MLRALVCLVVLPWAATVEAQSTSIAVDGRAGPRSVLAADREISLARSAAPASVSDDAAVWLWRGDKYSRAVEGTNGVECYVSRSWRTSIEPHCFDAEGAATIMLMEMRRVELRHVGLADSTVEHRIAADLASGRYRLPSRPALSWMMSSEQELIGDDGNPAGNWRPHLMIYYPHLTAEQLGLTGAPDIRHAILVDGGLPMSNLTIVVADFIDPR